MAKPRGNPYLPQWEYVPDGEPHVFEGRLYLFGSHDRFNGRFYCEKDYVVWSAPEDDLTQWRCEGISYRKNQDPQCKGVMGQMWAPDVCRDPDGKYSGRGNAELLEIGFQHIRAGE